jgi:hypothetical protein
MAGTVSVDAMLADAIKKMDALNSRMDALETTTKHPIKGDDDDKKDDAVAKGGGGDDDKKDDATTPKNKILDDDDDDKKDDAAAKADAKKADDDDKKDDDGELEIKHGKEKEEKEDSAKAKSDDDDDKKDDAFPPKKKDDSARADEIGDLRKAMADQAATIAKLTAMMKPRTDDEHAAFADAQSRADMVFSGFGQRAPRPLEGESLIDYRKRLASKLKGHSNTWKKAKFSRMDDDTFEIAEAAVYADATAAAANPIDLKAGELRMVTKVDPTTGLRTNVFYGKESFVKGMGRPGRRVASFRTLASQ